MDGWSQVVMASDASKKALKVAWVLSNAFNSDDGACFEKKETLAQRGGLSRQAFKDGLTELEKLRLITRCRELRYGKWMTVIYPAEPVELGSSQSRPSIDDETPQGSSLSRPQGSSLSRQEGLHCQDPCIRDLSGNRSFNTNLQTTAPSPARSNGLPEDCVNEPHPDSLEASRPPSPQWHLEDPEDDLDDPSCLEELES
jgi:hypothetical protein